MPKQFNPYLFEKCVETWGKIGRQKYERDRNRVVIYVALLEYLKTVEPDILKEPEYLETTDGEKFKNPNYGIIETIKDEIRDIDKTLRLSLWAK
ncbi:MAG: hypothetical protein Q8S01_00950 [Ignavibacteria bacterium]|nr:hypothetical protein [Ignavibacteria bacterium]